MFKPEHLKTVLDNSCLKENLYFTCNKIHPVIELFFYVIKWKYGNKYILLLKLDIEYAFIRFV